MSDERWGLLSKKPTKARKAGRRLLSPDNEMKWSPQSIPALFACYSVFMLENTDPLHIGSRNF